MLLEELKTEYDYIYVDLTSGPERDEVVNELEKWNPDISFPTIVIDDKDIIIGYEVDKIKEKFE